MPSAQENQGTSASADSTRRSANQPQPIIIQERQGFGSRLKFWVLTSLLASSLLANYMMYNEDREYFAITDGPSETFHSGNHEVVERLAIIRISGTIMAPFSDRVIKAIKKARNDDRVKGVLLAVDTPGGTVTDSHRIYHELKMLSDKKPVVVSMGSYATSGGYFVAMGAGTNGRIFAEPTTWTGSIGVIIPHYEVTDIAEKIGFKAVPLKTGEFKDSLSPFRAMTDRDKTLWENILNQSFELFLSVIDENRDTLDKAQVRDLATGQIYTAQDALKIGMIDEIGFLEDALEALKKAAQLEKARVVAYHYPVSLFDVVMGSAKATDASTQWRAVLEMTVPRAMFYCSWDMPVSGSD